MEEQLTDSTGLDQKREKPLADEILERCVRIVANVNQFKQPRLDKIQLYRDLYAGKVKRKFRQPFNVVLPVFSGAMDTLQAAFNDDLAIELHEQEPSDYLKVKKFNALWDMEVTSVAPTAKFPLKTRWDRANAIFAGRGFMANYAVSDPEYKNCFEIFELEDAIFQPRGGGHLENHLFAGRQNIIRSQAELEKGPYDQTKVKELLAKAAKTDVYPVDDEDGKAALAKFKAAGLTQTEADYVGESLFKLVEMAVTHKGIRYYIVFSPWYKIWLRFGKLTDISSSNLYPWTSWATHEDNKNFLSKSYADDLYGIADAVHTLFNQELTNREKKNFNARAYDREMFSDVKKLDEAQYRPDALVPADTKGGTRRISEGIYTFETAELRGTIDLINWMNETAGRNVGVNDLMEGGVQEVSKKATVVFAEQQAISKRLLLRSSSYTEAMGEVVKLFIQGCVDHMPAKKAIRMLGAEGEGWDEITRGDLDLKGDVDVRIISSSIDMRNNQLKKDARMKVLSEISLNPTEIGAVNPQWIVEEKLRSGGEYDDSEIAVAMDTRNYGRKDEVAQAHKAIQEIREGKQVKLFYGATSLFLEIIHDYANDHRSDIGDAMFTKLMDYIQAHAQIATDNMTRKARQDARQAMMAQPANPAETPPTKEPSLVPSVSQLAKQPA